MQAFFILGSHRHVARAELDSVLGADIETIVDAEESLIVDGIDANLSQLQARLGGTVKTGLIHATAKNDDELIEAVAGLIISLRPGSDRLKFGLSIYHGGQRGKLVAMRTRLERLAISVKRALQANDRSVRWVTSKIPVLSSVIVRKQKLLEEGIEVCLFPQEDKVLIGVTESVQDFEEWGRRDYGRPARDAKRGMLPPKLARIMVNLVKGDPERHVLLDPYCGVGTVLTEALDLGYRNVIGSDIDEKAVDATRENIEWLLNEQEESLEPRIIHTKAEALGTFLAPASVDRIVAEVHLGDPRTGEESRMELEKRLDRLVDMYTEGFRAFSKIVSDDARLVLAMPAYVVAGSVIPVRIVERAKLFGFTLDPFQHVETTDDGALRYGRDKQLVLRDVYRFRRGNG